MQRERKKRNLHELKSATLWLYAAYTLWIYPRAHSAFLLLFVAEAIIFCTIWRTTSTLLRIIKAKKWDRNEWIKYEFLIWPGTGRRRLKNCY